VGVLIWTDWLEIQFINEFLAFKEIKQLSIFLAAGEEQQEQQHRLLTYIDFALLRFPFHYLKTLLFLISFGKKSHADFAYDEKFLHWIKRKTRRNVQVCFPSHSLLLFLLLLLYILHKLRLWQLISWPRVIFFMKQDW